jgi:hypothetical protein
MAREFDSSKCDRCDFARDIFDNFDFDDFLSKFRSCVREFLEEAEKKDRDSKLLDAIHADLRMLQFVYDRALDDGFKVPEEDANWINQDQNLVDRLYFSHP